MALLSISLFAADIMHLKRELSYINEMNVDRLHIDIMDGHFVPLFGYNSMWIKEISREVFVEKEFHFMTALSDEMLDNYLALHPKEIIIHLEAMEYERNKYLLRRIKQEGIDCGIALSPGTSIREIERYLNYIDTILLMSSEPGQENSIFNQNIYEKVNRSRQIIQNKNLQIKISVDGGLDLQTAGKCIKKGADQVVIGRAFYKVDNKTEMVNNIHKFQYV